MLSEEIARLVAERVPARTASANVLDSVDAFLLAQSDGRITVDELCDVTPIPREDVVSRLILLERRGLVVLRAAGSAGEHGSGGAQPSPGTSMSPPLGASLKERRDAFSKWRRAEGLAPQGDALQASEAEIDDFASTPPRGFPRRPS